MTHVIARYPSNSLTVKFAIEMTLCRTLKSKMPYKALNRGKVKGAIMDYFVRNLMTQEAEASIALDKDGLHTICLTPEQEEEFLMRQYANGVDDNEDIGIPGDAQINLEFRDLSTLMEKLNPDHGTIELDVGSPVIELGSFKEYNDWHAKTIATNKRICEEILGWEERDGYWVQTGADLYVVWPAGDHIYDDNFQVFNPAMCDADALLLVDLIGKPVTLTFAGDGWVASRLGYTTSSVMFSDAVCKLALQVYDGFKACGMTE